MRTTHRLHYAISFDDVDAAGIVYYPRYFHFCHLAFEDLFNRHWPMSYARLIREKHVGFPTVHIDADYRQPLYYGDSITIDFAIINIGTSSMKVKYSFYGSGNNITFSATVTTVYSDLVAKKALALPLDLRCFLEEHAICE